MLITKHVLPRVRTENLTSLLYPIGIHGEEKCVFGFEREESQYYTCTFGELGNLGTL